MDERLKTLLAAAAADEQGREAPELAALLRANLAPPPLDAAALAASTRKALAGEMQKLALRAWSRRVLGGMAITIAPVPLVAALAVWALPQIQAWLAGFLPESLAAVLVASYGLAVALSVATACASVPLLAERMGPSLLVAPSDRSLSALAPGAGGSS
jgi:hypothetical protein